MNVPIKKIVERMKQGEMSVNPILNKKAQFDSAKIDLRLDNEFWIIQREEKLYHDTRYDREDLLEKVVIPYNDPDGNANKFILHPGEFALAKTFEYVDLPTDLIGRISGRSSLGRQGVVVHATASFVDPGYAGEITLELTNLGSVPVALYPRQRIAAIAFFNMDTKNLQSEIEAYDGKFGGGEDPMAASSDRDIDILDIEI